VIFKKLLVIAQATVEDEKPGENQPSELAFLSRGQVWAWPQCKPDWAVLGSPGKGFRASPISRQLHGCLLRRSYGLHCGVCTCALCMYPYNVFPRNRENYPMGGAGC
jgi:hypothetical protein